MIKGAHLDFESTENVPLRCAKNKRVINYQFSPELHGVPATGEIINLSCGGRWKPQRVQFSCWHKLETDCAREIFMLNFALVINVRTKREYRQQITSVEFGREWGKERFSARVLVMSCMTSLFHDWLYCLTKRSNSDCSLSPASASCVSSVRFSSN